MSTYDAWFSRYALRNRLMFFCRLFSPALGRGSSTLSTFLDRRWQRVNSISASCSKELNSLPDKKQFVSSAKSFITILLRDLCISSMNNRNKIGPKMDPWGTPYSHNSNKSD